MNMKITTMCYDGFVKTMIRFLHKANFKFKQTKSRWPSYIGVSIDTCVRRVMPPIQVHHMIRNGVQFVSTSISKSLNKKLQK
jgi:hypothetical protein